ncbi:hypothetical protein [Paractinoplanes hotanensis]|uniref:Minor tail protein n=1 Tax=Paractinoplanes hotanensis TaxID=2906497 RepID=A0ABT0Y2Y0_9ACTN|nr:hypothetical protein [Actinoplanes hotanensis]MCM4080406.1 hypothetical protein [Actinoplanes hotanensis]
MSIAVTLDTVLSRVRVVGAGLSAGPAHFQKSLNDGLTWTTLRGGEAVTVVSGDARADDYEFTPGVEHVYRIDDGTDLWDFTFTPAQTAVWLKSITRPFLNRAVSVVGHGDITLPARNGIFAVIGRSNPVAVTDVRLARQFQMTVKADSISDADAIELVLASGDPLYIQAPADSRDIPGGYVVVGDAVRRRFGHVSARRWFDLPCTVVAAPGAGVVGSTVTWESLLLEFGSWADVLTEFGTWADVAEYVASPSVVVVP